MHFCGLRFDRCSSTPVNNSGLIQTVVEASLKMRFTNMLLPLRSSFAARLYEQ